MRRLYDIGKRLGWLAYRYIKEGLPHFIDPRLARGSELGWWEEELCILILKGYGETGFELLPMHHPRDVANTCR